MTKSKNYNMTIYACFLGYIVQAIVNNFLPLLFITFRREYGIPLSTVTWLITVNFGVQLTVDALAPVFADRIGYRASMIIADIFCASGFALLSFLPDITGGGLAGFMVPVCFYAVGGGLLEVVVSPIVEACPTDNKAAAMALLHSFYCWGQAGTVLISTVFFAVCGIENWRIMALIWVTVPILDLIMFLKVPVAPLIKEGEKGRAPGSLIRDKAFLLFCVMMLCAGACELTVSQWASSFAEAGLKVSKSAGDLLGTMGFALFMGTSRAVYGRYSDRISLRRFMAASAGLCVISYMLIGLSRSPVPGLIGCMLCGLSVGIFWPGTFSLAGRSIKNGGTLMFAIFALAGDLGCGGGPTLSGRLSLLFDGDMHKGLLAAVIFPVIMLICVAYTAKTEK